MIGRAGHGANSWQLVLADLALILFLVTLSALAREPPGGDEARAPTPHVAPSQALFRPDPRGPTLAQWLAALPQDRRATLTVFARHSDEDRDAVWEQARILGEDAAAAGYEVRVIVTRGPVSELYASLAYDNEIAAR